MANISLPSGKLGWKSAGYTAAILLVAALSQIALGAESAPDATGATHLQKRVIAPAADNKQLKLAGFCLLQDGRIAAVLNVPTSHEVEVEVESGDSLLGIVISAVTNANKKVEVKKVEIETAAQSGAVGKGAAKADAEPANIAEVRILSADGKVLSRWPVDFHAEAINLGADGRLYVGGSGVVTRFDLEGKLLARSESPQVLVTKKNPEAMLRQARETLQERRQQMLDSVKEWQTQLDALLDKDDKSLTAEERELRESLPSAIGTYKRIAEERGKQAIDDEEVRKTAAELAQQNSVINAIAASDKHVFTTTRASKGYGYSVWRSDLDFKNPQRIVDGLSGCCGQMDVQCCGEELIVSENSRHRVVRYNADGKKLGSFGKTSRDGKAEGFSGCCNPMNTRVVGDKLYAAESNGVVKLFNREGKFQHLVGVAEVKPGCKSSMIDVTPDGKRVYYLDVEKSAICVLELAPVK